jgi:hypothetical protein
MGNSHLSNILLFLHPNRRFLIEVSHGFKYFENEFDIISLEYCAMRSKIINVLLLNIYETVIKLSVRVPESSSAALVAWLVTTGDGGDTPHA